MSEKVDEFHDSIEIDNRCPEWFRTELVGLADQAGKCHWWNIIGRMTDLLKDCQVEFDKILKDNKQELRK